MSLVTARGGVPALIEAFRQTRTATKIDAGVKLKTRNRWFGCKRRSFTFTGKVRNAPPLSTEGRDGATAMAKQIGTWEVMIKDHHQGGLCC